MKAELEAFVAAEERVCARCGSAFSAAACEICTRMRIDARQFAAELAAGGSQTVTFAVETEDPLLLSWRAMLCEELAAASARVRREQQSWRACWQRMRAAWTALPRKVQDAGEWALIWGVLLLGLTIAAMGTWTLGRAALGFLLGRGL